MLNIQHTIYINLDSRTDRNEHIIGQLNSVGIHAIRFSGILNKNGALGCSLSHLECLKIAKLNNWPHVLICEDDLEFDNPSLFVQQCNKFLANNQKTNWDVLLIAGNNYRPWTEHDDTCIKVTKCQSACGYIVQQHYYDVLIKNIEDGIQLLSNNLHFPIDIQWFKLQSIDNWFLIIPLTINQLPGYSNIEKVEVNYSNYMLNFDKDWDENIIDII